MMAFRKAATPLPNTYWVIPGCFLAGEHPGGASETDTLHRLVRLHDAGIDYFIDLTTDLERDDYQGLLMPDAAYWRSSILDTSVPEEVAQMREVQMRIRTALSLNRGVYVHCRAGIGRTGTVVGCYLADDGLDGRQALKRLNKLWRQSARSKSWPRIPQTAEQASYICNWPVRRDA